jgi:hypothetical protein
MHINDNIFYYFEITILQKKKHAQINSLINKLENNYQVVYERENNKIYIKYDKKDKDISKISIKSVFNRLADYTDWYTESCRIKNIIDESLNK